ncbi:uncharacterized protein DUF1934 [Mycoplasmopsis mustelae]|uniref:Uncharacterized protein DUF1934 n=1 Tax=Mycoplasmopsis mustelae TaxID=171289 RepID=A0A4R7UDY4_9BACT|nr:DUF1934 family protein [Mycoplasmopsis mustelae]TDV24131.1 uncharacterized protein DUF1934 [Mycoplasmopsis mustelae]
MKINFKSTIKQNNDERVVDFDADLEYTNEDGYQVFTFSEPSEGIRNRIEVSDNEINIYAGSTSVYLKYNQVYNFDLDIDHHQWKNQIINLDSHWFLKDFQENSYSFTYTLSRNGTLLGEYAITLTIKE